MDIIARKEQIQLLIAADNIPEAVRRVMDYVKDFGNNQDDLNEVIVQSSTYQQILKLQRQEQIDFDEATKRRNKVLFGLLGLLNQVETNFVLFNSATQSQA